MASLAGRSLVSSYKELLKLNNATPNSGISASLQTVEDGFAGATALQISNAGVASTGTLASTGNLAINTDKFTVAASSGNTAVAGTLGVTGDLAVNTNKFTVAAASGNTVVAGTLGVTGASTLAALGATTGVFSSTLSATGDLAINTNKFNVTAASGNTAIAGTLSAAGNFAINTNQFTVAASSGNTVVAGTLSATGDLAINTNKFNVTAASGNTSIAGTLSVADTVDFSSTGAMRIPRGTAGQRPAGDTGMLRFNTNTQSFEGHNGTAWGAIGGSGGVGTSQYVRQTFTATAGQTSFTVTGGYTPDSVDVFQNGVKLVNGSGNDVTITSGTAVVLATGAAAGDIIDVIGLASGNFAGPATAKRQNFTASAGQTVFTVTGGYTPNQLDVFQNGTKLLNAVDVDVSNGSTFTLTTGANLNDTVEVVGFTAANTIAGTLQFQNGTAAAPSITNFNDTNTGIYWPAADTLGFVEGGVEAMRIDSSGNVGIGTASPSGASGKVLEVNGGAGQARLVLKNDTTGAASGDGSQIALVGDSLVIQNRENSHIAIETNNTERLRINGSGDVLIGGTNTEPAGNSVNGISLRPSGNAANGMVEICNGNLPALILGSTTGDATLARFRRAGSAVGSISVTASATAYNTSSDYRLKTNLEFIQNGIDRIKQLPVYRFNWISDIDGNKVDGFVAHEAQAIVPECVTGEKDAVDADGNPVYQGIDQSKIVPLLTAALKEAIAKIETLESKVAAFEAD